MKANEQRGRSAGKGFSLLEVLVTVVAIGILASVAVVGVEGVQEKVRTEKLAQDVEVINRAIRVYESMGGDFTGVPPHPHYIVGALKTTDENVDEAIGLTGKAIDSRLQAELMLTADELASDAPRAVWNVAERRFDIVNDDLTAGAKVRAFVMMESGEADELVAEFFGDFIRPRNGRAFRYARTGTWVWDYTDSAAAAAPAPTGVTLIPETPTTPPADPPGPPQLDPPVFTLPSGKYPLSIFPAPFKIENPNDPAVSEVYFWTPKKGWELYGGNDVIATPKMYGVAFVKSLDEENWSSSVVVNTEYFSDIMTLALTITAPAAVSWAEAGGAVEPGGPVASPAAPGQIGLTDAPLIPDYFENSDNFMVYWTIDGSDPLSPGTRYEVAAFSDGFPGQSQDVDLPVWGPDSSLTIKAAAVSLDAEIFASSEVTTHTVAITKTKLRDPILSDTAAMVTIDLQKSFGDMPAGARIHYTLDGTDPAEVAGVPTTGIGYTGPFSVKGNGIVNVPVRARVFGPAGYEHWFTPSETASTTVPVPPAALNFRQTATLPNP